MHKKAQAAMEFLMTYGWAILVVLVAIGALAYFGVLNPSRFLPNSCTLTPGLSCADFNADSVTGNINLVIQNGMGDNVDFSALGVSAVGLNCTSQSGLLNDGASQTYTFPCTGLTAGGRLKADVTGTYTKGTSTLPHSFTGQLVTQAS